MNELDKSLARISDALHRFEAPLPPARAPQGPGQLGTGLGVVAIVMIVAGFATGHWALVLLGLLFAAGGSAAFALPQLQRAYQLAQGGPATSTHPSIGMGAEIAEGAVIEPGASVEMGASVGRDAVVKSGAVVRMGASVKPQAVIERGAVIGWGADVGRRAVVGENAAIGAGATVKEAAQVPAGMRVSPGSTYAATSRAQLSPPREQSRLAAVCSRLEAEVRSSPEHVRAFLGASESTIGSLRKTCEDLERRERAMREEADPKALAKIDEERAQLAARLATEQDPQLKASLQGAIAAIDEVKRQRDLLRVGADRLQAEQTRLVYTLEGLASQFVRLRTAGPGAAPAELEQGLAQLRSGMDAIADALEEVSREAPAAMRELAVAPPDEQAAPKATRVRE